MSGYELEPGNAEVGEALRDFFLALMRDHAEMSAYHSREGREDVIRRWAERESVSEEAQRVLRTGSLAQIEEHVRAARYNPSGGTLMSIVWPPMRQPADET